ncbi:MAG: DUF5652 family protein [Chloroflexota bacterium]
MPSNWGFPAWSGLMLFFVLLLVVWSTVWKGVALWRAGRNGNLGWFVVLFILNTAGILPIIYIFGFSRRKAE